MPLSVAQIADLRDYTGDTDTVSPKVTDAKLNLDYTTAGEDFNLTVVFVLRRLLGIYRDSMDKSTELASERIEQRFRHIRDDLLPYWEGVAGVAGGMTLSTTTTYTYRADSKQTEEPDYSEGR